MGLLIGIIAVVYYRFYGNEQEKETSKKVINTGTDLVKDLGKLTWSLLKKGKESLEEGNYDDTMDNITGLIDDLKEKAGKLDDAKEIYDQISQLERKRDELQKDLAQSQVQSYDETGSASGAASAAPAEENNLKEDIRRLLNDTEDLMNEIERK